MGKSSKNIAERVTEAIQGPINDAGYVLWDVEYVKEGASYYLRVTIDIDDERGININDCEKVHHMIDPILDEADPIEGAYNLEVSSPGIERELRLPWHFSAMAGEQVELKLFTAFEGRKRISGKLNGYDEADGGKIEIEEADGRVTVVPRAAVSKAVTVFDYDNNDNI